MLIKIGNLLRGNLLRSNLLRSNLFRHTSACFSACLMAGSIVGGQLKLQVTSAQGAPLHRITAGTPCLVEIVVPGDLEVQQPPTIAGIAAPQIIQQRQSTQIYVSNGRQHQQKTTGYLVNFTTPGTFTIGPARIVTSQGTFSSNETTITVDEKSVSTSNSDSVWATWVIKPQPLFVGQPVAYQIRFYFTNPEINQVLLAPFSIEHARLSPQVTTEQGTQTIGATTYSSIEWHGWFTPEEPGSLVLPQVAIEYAHPEERDEEQRHSWINFMTMFGSMLTREQQYVAPKKITIKPIPPFKGTVLGVGTIEQVYFTVDPHTIKQHEPLTCTLRIIGTFDEQAMTAPQLTLPDSLKSYPPESSSTGSLPHVTKTFSYIFQGTQAGTFQIPPQKFTFFNPETERFRSFTTPAIPITITPAPATASYIPTNSAISQKQSPELIATTSPQVTTTTQQQQTPLVLPFWLLYLLWCMPPFWKCMGPSLRRWERRWHTYVGSRYEIYRTKKMLNSLLTSEQIHQFWQEFLRLTCKLTNLSLTSGIDPTLIAVLTDRHITTEELAQWKTFWKKAMTATFFVADQQSVQELRNEMHEIIQIMKTYCVEKPWHR